MPDTVAPNVNDVVDLSGVVRCESVTPREAEPCSISSQTWRRLVSVQRRGLPRAARRPSPTLCPHRNGWPALLLRRPFPTSCRWAISRWVDLGPFRPNGRTAKLFGRGAPT